MKYSIFSLIFLFTISSIFADSASEFDSYGQTKFDLSSLFSESTMSDIRAKRQELYDFQQSGSFEVGRFSIESTGVSLKPIHIALPKISTGGGCEQIDVFCGGLNIVNKKEAYEELFKSIVQNSRNYAFNLALSQLCPSIRNIANEIANASKQVNDAQINSCEASQALVNGLHQAIRGKDAHERAMENFNGGKDGSYKLSRNEALKKMEFTTKNITYGILTLQINGAKNLTESELALAMNLMGTISIEGDPPVDKKISSKDFSEGNPSSMETFDSTGVSAENPIKFSEFISNNGLSFLEVGAIQEVLTKYTKALKKDTHPLESKERADMETLLSVADFPMLAYYNVTIASGRQIDHTNIAKGLREALILKIFDTARRAYENNLSLIEIDPLLIDDALRIQQEARESYFKMATNRSINVSHIVEQTLFLERSMADSVAKKVLDWQTNARGGKK